MLVTGSGFPPGAPLEALLFSDPVRLGSTTADPTGRFRLVVTVPRGTSAGVHTLRVGQVGTGLAAETTLVLASRPGIQLLSRTGGDVAGPARLALALVVIGFLCVGLSMGDRGTWSRIIRRRT